MANDNPTFYPPYLFHHSPTYTAWARLTCADLQHRLVRRPDYAVSDLWFFAQTNHPIRWVRVVGIVVAIDEWETRTQFTIDDGSGEVMDAITWNTSRFRDPGQGDIKAPNLAGVRVGAVVKAKGSVGEFRGRRQMGLRKCEVLKGTDDEVKAWREMTMWKREVLMKPWVVEDKIIRREKRRLRSEQQETGKKRKVQDEDGEGNRKRPRGDGEGFQGRRPEKYVPRPRSRSPKPLGSQEDSGIGDAKTFKGRRRPKGYVPPPRSRSPTPKPPKPPPRSRSPTPEPPKPPMPPGSRSACPDSQPSVQERRRYDYSDLEFEGVKGSARPEKRKVNAAVREATPSSGRQEEAHVRSTSILASDLSSTKRRRIRTVPTEKFVPPIVTARAQDPPAKVEHSADTLHFSQPMDDIVPPPSSTFKGRRRPGTLQLRTTSQPPAAAQQGAIWSQKSPPISQILPQTAGQEILPAPKFHQRAWPEAAPPETPSEYGFGGMSMDSVNSQIGPPSHTQQEPYSTFSSQLPPSSRLPSYSQPPISTFKGRRRTGPVQAQETSTKNDEYSLSPPIQTDPSYAASDDIPSTFSTYYPTQNTAQYSPQTSTFKGRRRAQPQTEEPTSSQLMPPPQPPSLKSTTRQPKLRVLKATIISYLRRTDATTTSAQLLVSTPELAVLGTSALVVDPALQSLAADGYLLPTNTPGVWAVVGYALLRDIIDSETKSAMRRSKSKVVSVSTVWKKAGQRGGYWAGVGKEVVREVLGSFFGAAEGWVEVKEGWEWRGG
jgi:hypothetical protein